MAGRHLWLLPAVVILALAGQAAAATVEAFPRPANPICASPPVGGLSFCSMVNYDVSAAGASLASADAAAEAMYSAIDSVLARFDCSSRYSSHNCSSCRDAYKFWVCGMMLPACSDTGGADFCKYGEECPTATSAKRLCFSICEDVVRKCPYIANFKCPTDDTIDYTGNAGCNKLTRSEWPPGSGQPWPGTFSAAGTLTLHAGAPLLIVTLGVALLGVLPVNL